MESLESEMNFRRQGKPVHITISGGDAEDRYEWAVTITRFLSNQPCMTETRRETSTEHIAVYPDAVND